MSSDGRDAVQARKEESAEAQSKSSAPEKAPSVGQTAAIQRRDAEVAQSRAWIQFIGDAEGADAVHHHAAEGLSGAGGPLPHGEAIQRSFGHHDISDVQAHVGGRAADAAAAMGAEAYASGSRVAFAGSPDLHTAAHEAAHIVQQRSGLSLPGGVGRTGDRHERHADAVADAVVAGQSAAPLLDAYGGGGSGGAKVQRREAADIMNGAETDVLRDEEKRKRLLAEMSEEERAALEEDLEDEEPEAALQSGPEAERSTVVAFARQKQDHAVQGKLGGRAPVQAKGSGKKTGPAKGHFVKTSEDLDGVPEGVPGFNQLVGEGRYGHAFAHLLEEPMATAEVGWTGLTGAQRIAMARGLVRNADTVGRKGKRILNAFVTAGPLQEVEALIPLFEIRFNVVTGQTLDSNKTGKDWEASLLRRCWNVMVTLPDSHIAQNPYLEYWTRWDGGFGFYSGGRNEVAMPNSSAGGGTQSDGSGAPLDGVNWYDATVRHEVGHAVDSQKSSLTKVVKYDQGPKWKNHKPSAALDAMLDASSGTVATWSDAGQRSAIVGVLRDIVKNGTPMDLDTDLEALSFWSTLDGGQQQAIKDDEVTQAVRDGADDGSSPWDKLPNQQVIGGRSYHSSYAGSWVSYQASEVGKRVSNYQFRAPNEWFADAYSAYYMPVSGGGARGDHLNSVNPDLKAWFDANIHEE